MSDEMLRGLADAIIECDALPPGTLLMLPGPQRRVQDHLPDGTPTVRKETIDEYAQRCVAIKAEDEEPLSGEVGYFVPVDADHCSRCRDVNIDDQTRICLTCTYPDDPCSAVWWEMHGDAIRRGWR